MMVVAILISIFAGFGAGYATRAWRSRRRRVRHPLYQPYGSSVSRQNASLARAIRVFWWFATWWRMPIVLPRRVPDTVAA